MRTRRHDRRAVNLPRKLDQVVFMASYIQDTYEWGQWQGRRISLRKALEMERAGEAEVVTRKTPNGIVAFYRETKPSRAEGTSPCTLTLATMHAVANAADELASGEWAQVVKFRVWAFIGDDRAVCVRPRTTGREKIQAQALFDRARGVGRQVQQGKHRQSGEVRTLHFESAREMNP